ATPRSRSRLAARALALRGLAPRVDGDRERARAQTREHLARERVLGGHRLDDAEEPGRDAEGEREQVQPEVLPREEGCALRSLDEDVDQRASASEATDERGQWVGHQRGEA